MDILRNLLGVCGDKHVFGVMFLDVGGETYDGIVKGDRVVRVKKYMVNNYKNEVHRRCTHSFLK